MKKLILLVCFLLVSSQGFSQLFVENFDYTANTLITANGWTAISGAGTNAIPVINPGLTFTSYIGSGIGNKATLTTSGEDDQMGLTSSQTSGTLYASFMLNISAAQTGDYFFALRSIANSHNGRVYAKTATGGFNLGIGNTGVTAPVYAAPVYTFGTTYLVIVKYQFVAGAGNDLLSLFVFDTPPPSVEPVPTIGPSTLAGQTDAVDISSVLLRQGSAGGSATLAIDGIYVETSYNNSVLPVELSSFVSTVTNRDVTLNWSTASELNNSGFGIERSSANGTWSSIGNVNGNGTTNLTSSYSFTDRNLASGIYNYRLKQTDLNGNFQYFNLSNEVNVGVPSKFELSQNYPNPFNPSTKINYDIPFDSKVSIRIFDMSGKEVSSLVNDVKTAGYYTANFNASNLGSGVYFYTISAEANGQNFVSTKKMILVK